MIQLTAENTTRAIERCKALRPKVEFIAERTFKVFSANNDNFYIVRFEVRNGQTPRRTQSLKTKRLTNDSDS